ncbi:MAG: prepilin-type N-terminal cleavage/methylation domain-containing protein [bacterium]
MKNRNGFTLIETIMSIVILGIIIIPIAAGYMQIVTALSRSSDLAKAVNISKLEFSIVNNIDYSDAALANGYNTLTSNYQNTGYDLRRQVSYEAGSDVSTQSLKGITVTIYRPGSSTSIISTKTMRAKNVIYEP